MQQRQTDGRDSVSLDLEHDDKERWLEVRRQAIKIWYGAEQTASHPFFDHFDVSTSGLRVYHGALVVDSMRCEGTLLVPMFDCDRNLVNLAFVPEDGQRWYLSKEHVAGNYFSIGRHKAGEPGAIVITSGFLNGLRIHQQFGHPVAVAFTTANVPAIAELMADRHPSADIFVWDQEGALTRYSRKRPVLEGSQVAPRPIVPLRPLVAAIASSGSEHLTFQSTLETLELKDAKKLLAWIARRRLTELDRKLVMQAGPSSVRPVARTRAALAKLVEFGWVHTPNDKQYTLTESALTEIKSVSTPSSEAATDRESSSVQSPRDESLCIARASLDAAATAADANCATAANVETLPEAATIQGRVATEAPVTSSDIGDPP
jgi:hypothetical protein